MPGRSRSVRTRSGGRSRAAVIADGASAAVSTVQWPLSSSSSTRRILASSSTTRMRGVLWAGWPRDWATAALTGAAGADSANGPPWTARKRRRFHHTRRNFRRAGHVEHWFMGGQPTWPQASIWLIVSIVPLLDRHPHREGRRIPVRGIAARDRRHLAGEAVREDHVSRVGGRVLTL